MAGTGNSTKANNNKSKKRTTTTKPAKTSTSGARKSSSTRSSSTRSSSPGRSTSGRTTSKKRKNVVANPLKDEIVILIALACSLVLLLSNFNLAGSVGAWIKWFMFGMIGIIEYIFPIILAVTLIFMVSNKDMLAVARVKSTAVYALVIVLAAGIMRITDKPSIAYSSLGEMFETCADEKTSGGLLGGLLCKIMSPLGTVGTIVVLLILAVICIIIITEKSFISGLMGLKTGGSRMIKAARQDYDIYKEHASDRAAMKHAIQEEYDTESEEEYLMRRKREKELRNKERLKKEQEILIQKEQRAKERMNRKARGVTLDTELPRENVAPNSVDIKEIISDVSKDIDITDHYSKDIYEPDAVTENVPVVEHTFKQEMQQIKPYGAFDDEIALEESDATGNIGTESSGAVSEYNNMGYEPEEPDNNNNLMQSEHIQEISQMLDSQFTDQYDGSNETVGYKAEHSEAGEWGNQPTDQQASRLSAGGAASQQVSQSPTGEAAAQSANQQISHPSAGASVSQQSGQLEQNTNDTASSHDTYVFPPVELLTAGNGKKNSNQASENHDTAIRLAQTLQNFGVKVTITDISCGPSVTRYELQPEQGVKVSKIVSLSDDIKLNLAASDIRIEAPIPGKAAIGIEVPNKEPGSVHFRELIESDTFKNAPSAIAFAAGKDIAGKTIVADIAKMPHLLIAGATGSGKSVCINTIIMSILYKAHPDDVKLIMVDPKVVELSVYNGIPHLLTPVVTDPKKASGALNWAVSEMTMRYKKFAQMNVRDLKGYNAKVAKMQMPDGEQPPAKMPQIVIIIDELADLMMVAPGEVEDAICRLAQLARAAGIHLVIATQRPSVNVITGIIKANIPSRIAFSVSSGVDSRTIIDMNGAEKLLGKGDMLFFPSGYPKPVRVQGAFVSDEEVGRVVDFLKANMTEEVVYDEEVTNSITSMESNVSGKENESDRDSLFADAGRFVIEKEKGSIGMLQRYFKVGFNRAGRIMDQLADAGVVGPEVGTKPRKILMTNAEFEEFLKNNPN